MSKINLMSEQENQKANKYLNFLNCIRQSLKTGSGLEDAAKWAFENCPELLRELEEGIPEFLLYKNNEENIK